MSAPLGRATSPDGGVRVQATTTGLPVSVQLTREALRSGEQALAGTLLELSRTAGLRAGVHQRSLLARTGVAARTLDELGLPRPEDVPDDHEDTTSWVRRP